MIDRAISVCTFNRANRLGEVIEGVLSTKPNDARVFVCDDGSNDDTPAVVAQFKVSYIRGQNLGVGANKNRALFVMQDAGFMAIIEDDLVPIASGWFTDYENAALCTGIHHFSRVQDKRVEETIPEFSDWMKSKGLTPIYSPSVRGDLTFITKKVLKVVGGIDARFVGVGYSHGAYSYRIAKAGLIPHPNLWVDFEEISSKFKQIGDLEGGRWLMTKQELKQQLKINGALAKKLRPLGAYFHPLVMS